MTKPLRPDDPRKLGGYRLLARLGEGGMGAVYLAEDLDGRRVAIKLIRTEPATEPEFRARFRSEVSRARQVPPFCTAAIHSAGVIHRDLKPSNVLFSLGAPRPGRHVRG